MGAAVAVRGPRLVHVTDDPVTPISGGPSRVVALEQKTRPDPGGLDDAALCLAVASGDAKAFAVLADRHSARAYASALRVLKVSADAEDVAQDALVRLWEKAGEIEVGPGGVGPWVGRVAVNRALDRLRRRRPQDADALETLTEPAMQTRGMEDDYRAKEVRNAMDSLPERQRLALNLFHFEDFSQAEVAAALGVSEDAVESLLARARRGMKSALADHWRDLLPEADA